MTKPDACGPSSPPTGAPHSPSSPQPLRLLLLSSVAPTPTPLLPATPPLLRVTPLLLHSTTACGSASQQGRIIAALPPSPHRPPLTSVTLHDRQPAPHLPPTATTLLHSLMHRRPRFLHNLTPLPHPPLHPGLRLLIRRMTLPLQFPPQ